MRPTLAIMIIVATIVALVAGSLVMIDMGSGNHANCLAAIPGSPRCLGGMDPFQFAITHISTLLGISLGIVSPLAIFLFVAFVALMWLTVFRAPNPLFPASGYARIFIEAEESSTRKQRNWIALLEKRDPSLSCAMNV